MDVDLELRSWARLTSWRVEDVGVSGGRVDGFFTEEVELRSPKSEGWMAILCGRRVMAQRFINASGQSLTIHAIAQSPLETMKKLVSCTLSPSCTFLYRLNARRESDPTEEQTSTPDGQRHAACACMLPFCHRVRTCRFASLASSFTSCGSAWTAWAP